jgi:hypothetical protein
MLKDIIEKWEKVTWEVLSNVQTGRMSLADAQEKLDTLKAETAQIVAREVLRKINERVEEIEVTGDCPINEALHMNTMKQVILSQLRADLQSLEEELESNK